MFKNRINIRSPQSPQPRIKSPVIHFNNQQSEIIRDNNLRITLPNQSFTSSPSDTSTSIKNNLYSLRTTTNVSPINHISMDDYHLNKNHKGPMVNINYKYPYIQSNLTTCPQQYPNNIPNTVRYTSQIKQLRQELWNLKGNLKKLEIDVSYKQALKQDEIHTKNIQGSLNQLRLSFNNSQRTNQQPSNRHRRSNRRQLEDIQCRQKQKQSTNSIIIDENSKQSKDLGQKIDYIFNRMKEFEYSFDKNSMAPIQDMSSRRDKTQRHQSELDVQISIQQPNSFLQRINEKTLHLRRIQIKHIAMFMDLKPKEQQYQYELKQKWDNLPQQWITFEKQLDSIIGKFELVIENNQITKPEQRRFMKNKSKTSQFYQFNRLAQESKLRQEENQILKLQYTKLKSRMLQIDQDQTQIKSQLQQHKQQRRKYLSQIQRLEQLVQSQNEKIQIMNCIRQKKQDIQKQFHRIFQELNQKVQQKQVIIMEQQNQLKNQQKKEIINRDNNEKEQLKKYIHHIQLQNYQLIETIKEMNQKLDHQIYRKSKKIIGESQDSLDAASNNLKQLAIKIVKTLNLQMQYGQFTQEQILKRLIVQFERQKYSQVHKNYLQIIKLFEVKLQNPNHYKELMKQIDLFRNDIKLLFAKVEQLTQSNQIIQSEKINLDQQLTKYQFKLNQAQQKIAQMQKIVNKQNDKALVKEMAWLNQKISLKEQIKLLQFSSKQLTSELVSGVRFDSSNDILQK